MTTKFAFIAARASAHAIRFMCRVIGVTRSCCDAWQDAAPRRAERAVQRDSVGAEIREIVFLSKKRYGAPRIPFEPGAGLRDPGFRVSKRTVAGLMQEKGIRPPRGRLRVPITTDSRHVHAIAANLLERKFDAAMPDRVWLADISSIPTDEGWLDLAAVPWRQYPPSLRERMIGFVDHSGHDGDRRLVDL